MGARQTSVARAAGGRAPRLGTPAERPSQRQPPEPSFLGAQSTVCMNSLGRVYENCSDFLHACLAQPGGSRL